MQTYTLINLGGNVTEYEVNDVVEFDQKETFHSIHQLNGRVYVITNHRIMEIKTKERKSSK